MRKHKKLFLFVLSFIFIFNILLLDISVKAFPGNDTEVYWDDGGQYEWDWGLYAPKRTNTSSLNASTVPLDPYSNTVNSAITPGNTRRYGHWGEMINETRGWQFSSMQWVKKSDKNIVNYLNENDINTIPEDLVFLYESVMDANILNGGKPWDYNAMGEPLYYQRWAIVWYKRLKPKPTHVSTTVNNIGRSYEDKSKSTLWVTPQDITVRTNAYDEYPLDYGYLAQYSGNIRSNYISITGNKANFTKYTDLANGDGYNNYYGADRGRTDLFKDMRIYKKGLEPIPEKNNWNFRGIGSELILYAEDGGDFQVKTSHQNKYLKWSTSDWHYNFTYMGTNYQWIKSDGQGSVSK